MPSLSPLSSLEPTKCPRKQKKNEARKAKKEGRTESEKEKLRLLRHFKTPKICFLRIPELRKLIFCISIRRSRSLRPVNGFVVSFSSLQHDSDQKTARLASKRVFPHNLQEPMGQGRTIRNVMGGGGNFRATGIFFTLSVSLYNKCNGRSMNFIQG